MFGAILNLEGLKVIALCIYTKVIQREVVSKIKRENCVVMMFCKLSK